MISGSFHSLPIFGGQHSILGVHDLEAVSKIDCAQKCRAVNHSHRKVLLFVEEVPGNQGVGKPRHESVSRRTQNHVRTQSVICKLVNEIVVLDDDGDYARNHMKHGS